MVGSQQLLNQLRQMDEYEFEELVADVWEAQGWNTTVTSGSNDRGVDVFAEKKSPFQQKMLIQAKRYGESNKVGGPEIREYASLKQQEDNVDSVVIVTTSSFTPQAQQIAQDLNVKLIDGSLFSEMVNKEDISYEKYSLRGDGEVSTTTSKSRNTANLPDYVKDSKYTINPPIEYPELEGEIRHCFYGENEGFKVAKGNQERFYPRGNFGAVFVVTDIAVHIFIGDGAVDLETGEPTDMVNKFYNRDINEAVAKSGWTKGKIELYLSHKYEIPITDEFGNSTTVNFRMVKLMVNILSYTDSELEQACSVIEE